MYAAGVTYAVDQAGKAYLWKVHSPVLPTVSSVAATGTQLAVPAAGGIDLLKPGTGELTHTFPVGAPAAGSQVFEFGTGFVVAGVHTVLYR